MEKNVYLFWGQFEKYKYRLENRCSKLFIRLQKRFAKEKCKEQTKNFKI